MDDFLTFVATLLDVPRTSVTPETAYGELAAWDSVMHLRLVMEAEARYGVTIPLERVPVLTRLRDLARACGVEEA